MGTYISKSEIDTINFGKEFARKLNPTDIIVLDGELGARKN